MKRLIQPIITVGIVLVGWFVLFNLLSGKIWLLGIVGLCVLFMVFCIVLHEWINVIREYDKRQKKNDSL